MDDREMERYKMASLGRLLAGVVHEVGTPAGSILSNNQVARRTLEKLKETLAAPQPDAATALKTVETLEGLASVDQIACERIAALVRSLKTFARADDAELHEADVNANIRETVKLVESGLDRRVTVATDLGEIPLVQCYPQKLNQVLLNLLVNAGQAIEWEGKITVRTRREGDRVHIAVADTGRGITPENKAKMFAQPFTTKPAGVGTGLGLMISREIIIDRHGGSLDVESEVGAGSTFHVRIPLRQGAIKDSHEH